MSGRRKSLLLLLPLLIIAAITIASLSFGPFVRHQANLRAQRLGISLQIQSVYPSLSGLQLNQVNVSIPTIPSLSINLKSVTVAMKSVHIEGGSATIHQDFETFRSELQKWKASRPPSPSSSSTSQSKTSISLRNLDLEWPKADNLGTAVTIHALSTDDLLHGRTVSVGKIEIRHPRGKIEGESLSLTWSGAPDTRVESLSGQRLRAELRFEPDQKPDPAPPPDSQTKNSSSGIPGEALRKSVSRTAALVWMPMLPNGTIKINAFEVQIERGKDRINIGPGVLAAQQKDQVILVDLVPRVEEGKKGITFRGSIPMGDGPVILDVKGGPIPLSTLGVQEGNLGLKNVGNVILTANTHLNLHADGKNLSFDGTVMAKNVGIDHPRLAPNPVLGLELAAKMRGEVALDGSVLRLDEAEIDVGKVQFQLRGHVDRSLPKMQLDLRFGIPLVGCQAFLDALPPSLIPIVHGMTSAGTLSLSGHIRFDEANLKDFFLQYDAKSDCRILSVPPDVDVRRFRSTFKRRVYNEKGRVVEIESGPGSPGWVGREGINHFMEAAVMTCEDGRFRRHRGFDHEAIHNSVRENLKVRKFFRGASTISMQLAKNLYLSRDKTIARKLQELILTTYLEQALTKDQIMELYLNVIEFGPMTYGIGNASSRYFNKHPASLSLSQAMYLASILPNPRVQRFGADGRVSESWTRYLYKLMKIATKMRWISEFELERGLGEWVVQGHPDPIRIEPEPVPEEEGEAVAEEGEPFGWKHQPTPAY